MAPNYALVKGRESSLIFVDISVDPGNEAKKLSSHDSEVNMSPICSKTHMRKNSFKIQPKLASPGPENFRPLFGKSHQYETDLHGIDLYVNRCSTK